ncbi:MAG: tRNA epoxyqueuosine(34) reductase QueG [candidate division Zixibacteria bacterium]
MNSEKIKKMAYDRGFDLCGIVSPDDIPEAQQQFENWLSQGYHGEMSYMAKEPDRRSSPRQLLSGVRSIIMLGLNYYQPDSNEIPNGHGIVSKYARGKDYHKVIARKTKELIAELRKNSDDLEDNDFRWYVDYGPMLERSYAAKAGLGYIGKNSLLINKDYGSWIFLSEILTTLEIEPDNPYGIDHGQCGRCTMCIVSCPTRAIVEDGVIDSTKCISYLTIEKKGDISGELSQKMQQRLFGCDICQDVCPKNRAAQFTVHQEFIDGGVGESLNPALIEQMQTREDFLALTAGTPLTRAKLDGLKRNAHIAAANAKVSKEKPSPKTS